MAGAETQGQFYSPTRETVGEKQRERGGGERGREREREGPAALRRSMALHEMEMACQNALGVY